VRHTPTGTPAGAAGETPNEMQTMTRSRLRRLRTELTSHLRAKLVMLLLAGLGWFFVRTDREMEVEFTFPLEVDLTNLPGRVLLNNPPREVQVRLRGKGRNLLAFALFEQGRYLLRPEAEGGAHGVSAKHLDTGDAEDLAVQAIFPAVIQVQLDELDTRQLPVRFRGTVAAAEGFVLTGGPVLEPETVVVAGARSVLDTLAYVATEWADLSNRKRDLDERLALRRPWPTLSLGRPSVSLKASIEKRVERRLSGIPLEILGSLDSLEVEPLDFSLTLIGGERQLEAMDRGQIRAVLDLAELEPGEGSLPCRVIVPAGTSWRDPQPERFRVRPRQAWPGDSLEADTLAAAVVVRGFQQP
jgi:YbbR domain-containing protein